MRQFLNIGFLALALAVATTSAVADTISLTFDENGNGTWTDSVAATQNGYSGTSGSLQSFIGTDNTGLFGGGPVLTIELPAIVNTGAVGVGEPDASAVSDALMFTDAHGDTTGFVANEMYFISGDTDGLAADTGLNAYGQGLTLNLLENPDGTFSWQPDGEGGNTYNGLSTATPEPGTLLLLGGGLLGLARKFRRTVQ